MTFQSNMLLDVQWIACVISQKIELFLATTENFKAYREGTYPSFTYEAESKRKFFMLSSSNIVTLPAHLLKTVILFLLLKQIFLIHYYMKSRYQNISLDDRLY